MKEVNPHNKGCTIHEESVKVIYNYLKDLTSWLSYFFFLATANGLLLPFFASVDKACSGLKF